MKRSGLNQRPGTFLKQQIPGGRCLLDSVVGLAERSWCPLLCPWSHASQSVLCVSHHQGRAPGRGVWRCCWQAGGPRGKPFVGIGACGQAQYPSSQVSSQVSTQSPPQRAGFRSICALWMSSVCAARRVTVVSSPSESCFLNVVRKCRGRLSLL